MEIYGWLALTMARKGDYSSKAREYCEKALSLEPDYQWIRELIVDFAGEVREFERDAGAPHAASSAWRVAARHQVWAALVSRTVGPVVLGNAQKGGGPVSFHTVSAEVASP
ncbi:MAG: tetratricopeptide repeat protein [Vicinamibacteria bacterium]